jgi:hypothetical protein
MIGNPQLIRLRLISTGHFNLEFNIVHILCFKIVLQKASTCGVTMFKTPFVNDKNLQLDKIILENAVDNI